MSEHLTRCPNCGHTVVMARGFKGVLCSLLVGSCVRAPEEMTIQAVRVAANRAKRLNGGIYRVVRNQDDGRFTVWRLG